MTFSSDKFRKLDDLAGKLAKSKVLLGSEWARQVQAKPEESIEKKEAEPIVPEQVAVKLEDAVAGEVVELTAGRYYRIRRKVTSTWPEAAEIVRLYRNIVQGLGYQLDTETAGEDLLAVLNAPHEAVTYLDIESCGFAGNTIFLVGWCYFDGQDDLIVEQALARDYSEEAGIIQATAERLAKTQVLVTYNGKSFDIPSIRDRAVIHRVNCPRVHRHIDMLHQARAHWKKFLPNCQLQTVELFMCRRPRRGDISGADIPQAYHDFVKTFDARKLKVIIHHNFLDLVTVAEITARLLAGQVPEY